MKFISWAAHQPALLVAIAGFVCGAALMAIFQFI
jgi:hypothetical protein